MKIPQWIKEVWELLGLIGQQVLNVVWWDRITDHHSKIREEGYHEGFQSGFLHGQQAERDSKLAEKDI